MTDIHRVGKSLRIGAAVALDDDAVEPEKDPAVGFAGIHLFAERAKSVARQNVAELREQRLGHGAPEILGELAGGALGGLEADKSALPPVHDHVVRPLAGS